MQTDTADSVISIAKDIAKPARPDCQKVSLFELQALVDGELDPHHRNVIMEKVKKNRKYLSSLEELAYQKFLLKEWWKSIPQN